MQKLNTIITTSLNPKNKQTLTLQKELTAIIPHSISVDSLSPYPLHLFMIKIIEQRERPFIIRLSSSESTVKLPTIELSIIQYKNLSQMHRKDISAFLCPELIVGGFSSLNGGIVVDWLMQIFPMDVEDLANRAVSFHAVNDFILFRTHRYRFKDSKSVDFQDVGPHLTLRLRKIIDGENETIFKYSKNEYKNNNVVL